VIKFYGAMKSDHYCSAAHFALDLKCAKGCSWPAGSPPGIMRRGQNIYFTSTTKAWLITLFFMRLKTSVLLRNTCDIDIFTTTKNAFSQHEKTL